MFVLVRGVRAMNCEPRCLHCCWESGRNIFKGLQSDKKSVRAMRDCQSIWESSCEVHLGGGVGVEYWDYSTPASVIAGCR